MTSSLMISTAYIGLKSTALICLNKGCMESLGDDDVSIFRARK